MAKKQTRRSISVSRNAYERLKAFCETSGVSMSQFVESGIHEKLDDAGAGPGAPAPSPGASAPRPAMTTTSTMSSMSTMSSTPRPAAPQPARPAPIAPPQPRVMTSAAARFAVDPPPPIIKPRPVDHEPKPPAEPTPGQIFTF